MLRFIWWALLSTIVSLICRVVWCIAIAIFYLLVPLLPITFVFAGVFILLIGWVICESQLACIIGTAMLTAFAVIITFLVNILELEPDAVPDSVLRVFDFLDKYPFSAIGDVLDMEGIWERWWNKYNVFYDKYLAWKNWK